MGKGFKRRDGFEGEKLINIPQKVWKAAIEKDPILFPVYVSQIGYFPKASYHYRELRKGCEDNILIYCVQGIGYYVLDNKRYTVRSNQFILIPATDRYIRYWSDEDDPWTIYWVHYTGNVIDTFNKSLNVTIIKGPYMYLLMKKRSIYGKTYIKHWKWVTVLKICVVPVFAFTTS